MLNFPEMPPHRRASWAKNLPSSANAIILLIALLFFLYSSLTHSAEPSDSLSQNLTSAGINYPWLNYGTDFGSSPWGHLGVSRAQSTEQVEKDFSELTGLGFKTIRWFLFGDGRSSPEFDSAGQPINFDSYFFNDMDAALAMAARHDIKIIFVLWDFKLAQKEKFDNGVLIGGRSSLIENPKWREAWQENILKPLLDRYGHCPEILAWEIINEPERASKSNALTWVNDPVSMKAMKTFIKDAASIIHEYSNHAATVGSAWKPGLKFWQEAGLDFYQVHHYDWMDPIYPLGKPLGNTDRPYLLGEFPTADTHRQIINFHETAIKSGYTNAFPWSWRAQDRFSDPNNIRRNFGAPETTGTTGESPGLEGEHAPPSHQ